MYIDRAKAEFCYSAVLNIITNPPLFQKGDPTALSFKAGELFRREGYKHDVARKGHDVMMRVPWNNPDIIQKMTIPQAADEALRVIPNEWERPQNLVDWRDIDGMFSIPDRQFRDYKAALYKLFASDDEKGAFEGLLKALGGKFAIISYFFFLKDPERFVVMRPNWFAKQLIKLGAPTTCTNLCSWENYQLFLSIMREVQGFLQEKSLEPVSLLDTHSWVFSLYLVDEYKKAIRNGQLDPVRTDNTGKPESSEGKADEFLESRITITGTEGRKIEYYTTKYERNPKARTAAIRIHGCKCMACGFDFEEKYGELGKGFIEVHHIKLLYSLDEEITPDPDKDMVCLCANCHRMIHRRQDCIMTVEELRALINHVSEGQ